MSATLTVTQSWTDGKRRHVVGTIALSGSYVTGGVPLNLAVYGNPTSQPIVVSDIVGMGGYYGAVPGTLYSYRYVPAPSTDPLVLQDGLLRIFDGTTELSAGAFPDGTLSDIITFYGIFQKY